MLIPLSFVCAFWHTMYKQDCFSLCLSLSLSLFLSYCGHFNIKWSVLDECTPRTINIGMFFQRFKMKLLNTFRVYHTWCFNVLLNSVCFLWNYIFPFNVRIDKVSIFWEICSFWGSDNTTPILWSLDTIEFFSFSQNLYMFFREDVDIEFRGVNSL